MAVKVKRTRLLHPAPGAGDDARPCYSPTHTAGPWRDAWRMAMLMAQKFRILPMNWTSPRNSPWRRRYLGVLAAARWLQLRPGFVARFAGRGIVMDDIDFIRGV